MNIWKLLNNDGQNSVYYNAKEKIKDKIVFFSYNLYDIVMKFRELKISKDTPKSRNI